MANNPNVNKVVYGNQTVMDITDSTVEPENVLEGEVFYDRSGTRQTGSAVIPDISNCYQTTDTAETAIADNDYFPFYDTSATGKRKSLWSNIKEKLKAYIEPFYELLIKGAVGWTGKNLIPYPYSQTTKTENNVTFTANEDGTVTVTTGTGGASAYTRFYLKLKSEAFNLPNGRYILSSGSSDSNVRIQVNIYNGSTYTDVYYNTRDGEVQFTLGDSPARDRLGIEINIQSGAEVSNLLIKPMIRLASISDATYEPYHSSVKQTLRDAEVIEGKNLIPYPYRQTTRTSNGVTYTDNGDGTITLSTNGGTSTAVTIFYLKGDSNNPSGFKLKGNYIATCENATNNYYLRIGETSAAFTNIVEETNISFDTETDVYMGIRIASGVTISNVTLKPMLRYATEEDATYEPYYIPLKDSKFDRSEQGILGAKNLLSYPYYETTKTLNGITFTDNGNGSITLTGTATAYCNMVLLNYSEDNNKYAGMVLSGGYSNNVWLRYREINSSSTQISNTTDTGNGATLPSLGSGNRGALLLAVAEGTDLSSGLTIYPMIRLASDSDNTWQPYAMTNQELTGKVGTLATLDSPALTGTPTAPTATAGTNTTQIATTAFVKTAITGQDYKNIHYLQNNSSQISNKKLRFPWSGYSKYINPSSILIPTCEPKNDGTPYKFKSLKAFYTQDSQGNYSGYAELELVDNESAYTFNHIFELMICEYY